jgi:hypothetical protein
MLKIKKYIYLISLSFLGLGTYKISWAATTATSTSTAAAPTSFMGKITSKIKNTATTFVQKEKAAFQQVGKGIKEGLKGNIIQGSKDFYAGAGKTFTAPPVAGNLIGKAGAAVGKSVETAIKAEKVAVQQVFKGVKTALNGEIIAGSKDFYSGVGKTITAVPLVGGLVKKGALAQVRMGKEAKGHFGAAYRDISQGNLTGAIVNSGRGLQKTNDMVKWIPIAGGVMDGFFKAGKGTIQGGMGVQQVASDVVNRRGLKVIGKSSWDTAKKFGGAVEGAATSAGTIMMAVGAATGIGGVLGAGTGATIAKIAINQMAHTGTLIRNAKGFVTSSKRTIMAIKNKDKVEFAAGLAGSISGVAGMAAAEAMVFMPVGGTALTGLVGRAITKASAGLVGRAITKGSSLVSSGTSTIASKIPSVVQNSSVVQTVGSGLKTGATFIAKKVGVSSIPKEQLPQFITSSIVPAAFGLQFTGSNAQYAIENGAQVHAINKQLSQVQQTYDQAKAAGDEAQMAQSQSDINYLKGERKNYLFRTAGDMVQGGVDVLAQGKADAVLSTGGALLSSSVGNAGFIMAARKEMSQAKKTLEEHQKAGASPEQLQYDQLEVDRTKLAYQQSLTTAAGEGLVNMFLGSEKGMMQTSMALGSIGGALYGATEGQQKKINAIYDQQDRLIEQANQEPQAAPAG